MSPLLSARGVGFGYGDRDILRGVTIDLLPGEVTILLGPNGAGKSTLIRILSWILPPREGEVLLCGRPPGEFGRREMARLLSVVGQDPPVDFPMTVESYVALGTVLLYLLSRGLDLLLLGDHAAFQTGLSVERVKTATYLTASLLAGSVVAVSGLIGFVGLIVPHGARVLVGSGHRRLLPAAFLLGGAFLVLSDTLARAASPAGELPVGAVTALAGAPFFLYLLRRNGGRS